jgi:hypothetical protein
MTISISARQKLKVSTARRDDIDASLNLPGKIVCYEDPQPAAGDAPASTPVAEFILTDPCGTVDAAGLHFTVTAPGQASKNGTVRWARVVDGDGNYCMDGVVRMTSDGDAGIADFIIDNAVTLQGGFIVLLSATLAEGG